eukprot:TRINITY_DN459_c1_g3_i1.p1 TRINITY_DN459_c1_g3~~TRINITY_DN459_c1_g3_i1.p1  ORF type:complete len:1599 (+),score=322.31 TRINITY_DN459_c1_g3_i1:70-4866(+)
MIRNHVTPASIQQEKYLQLEQSFSDHQLRNSEQIQAGFSIGRRIRWREGKRVDLSALKRSIGIVLQRSPILQCSFVDKTNNSRISDPTCEILQPPFSDKFLMQRPDWDPSKVESFIHFQTVAEDCTDLMQPCTTWLLKPFEMQSGEPLLRFVVLRRNGSNQIEELLIVGHRSILDAWSLEWVVQEVIQVYEQLLTPQGSQLLGMVAQMSNNDSFGQTICENDFCESDEFRSAVSFWATHLSAAMPVVQVPTDRPRPQCISMKQARFSYVIPNGQTTQGLRKLTVNSTQGVHSLLISTFVTWLSRMTAEKDIVIGVLTNLRREGHQSSIGPLTNRIPLRTDLSDTEDRHLTFREIMSKVASGLSSVMAHKHVEFEQVIESPLMKQTLEKSKTTLLGGTMQDQDPDALSPLFKVLYIMDDQLTPPLKRDHLSWSSVDSLQVVGSALAPYDLTLRVNQRWDGGVELVFLYNAQLFTRPFIASLMDNYAHLLRQVVADPGQNMYKYSLVTPSAKALLPDPVRPQDEGWPGALVNIFSKNAQDMPNQLAIEYEGHKGPDGKQTPIKLTYRELNMAANKLANKLTSEGVTKGDVVGIYGFRSPAVVVAIIALYKCGAAYSMMDPQYPGERIITCMKIAGIRGWIRINEAPVEPTDVCDFLNQLGLKVNVVLPQPKSTQFDECFAKFSPEAGPDVEICMDDTAVVTFTSGSTGIPKGVQGRQSSLTTFYPWLGDTFNITSKDRFGMCSGIAHDPLQRDIFTPLFFGASIYIPDQDTISTPGCLGEYMKKNQVTVCCFTPALGQILVASPVVMQELRFVMFVGDMLIKRDVNRLRTMAPNCRIINMWGTTETSRAVGYFDLLPNTSIDDLKEVIPCGKGMKDCQMILLNPLGTPAGIGEAAEIYMRSCHLAKGYLGLPKDTAAKFVQSPFSDNKVDKWYRSGDLGHYLSDGTVECLGRVDDQIKIRGFRIELGEINAKLSRHEEAKENVTVAKTIDNEKVIVSYVVPTDSARLWLNFDSPKDLKALSRKYREFLKSKVPHYMVPSHIVILQRMPLTPNAKIDHKALPQVDLSSNDEDETELAALLESMTAVEKDVFEIWSEHLKGCRSAIQSKEDSFFDLGGHSLLATVVTMELNKKFGCTLPLNALFSTPTLTGMAASVSCRGQEAEVVERDYMLEAHLPSSISIENVGSNPQPPPAIPNGVFITGTPGFLATFILIDVLKQTSGPVYCLVWSQTDSPSDADFAHARNRIVSMLKATLTWKEEYSNRIIPCLGDLSKPKLGLSPSRWEEVCDRVDLVVHSGAVVHWLFPYEKMKAANVDGTVEVLKLCCTKKLKVLSFISTTNVYEAEYSKHKIIKEDVELETGRGLTGGYTQSKWVADKLVMNAAKKGLPVMCLRPSFISGDSHSGAWTTDDFLVRLIKGCIQMKMFPRIEPEKGIDMSPVNWMSAASVAVSFNPSCRGKHFNLINDKPVPYCSLFRMCVDQGYEMKEVEYSVWRQHLLETSAKGEDNALSAIISHFTEGWASGLRTSQVHDKQQLTKFIDGSPNCEFPDMDLALQQALCYLVGSGFISPPPGGLKVKENVPWKALFERNEVQMITRARRSTTK